MTDGKRELRGLVPAEIAVVVAIAVLPVPEQVPRSLLLVVAASLSRWARGRSWGEVVHGPALYAAIGAAAGLGALVVALLAGTPAIEALTGRGVEWSAFPIVRGSPAQLAIVMLYLVAAGVAAEMALRGWLVERVLELGRGNAVIAILVGGFAEALCTSGDLAARVGAGAFGAGLGWMYVAAGRSVVAPACARLAFQLGAVTLEALRLLG